MTENEQQSLTPMTHLAALGNAIALWAQGNTRPETYDRDDKVQDKMTAVRAFFSFVGKHPSEVTPADVAAWRQHLESLGQKPATVYARLSRLSSFYQWLLLHPQLSAHIQVNPVLQARPRFPQPYQSESVKAWSDDEMNALLAIVKRVADAGSIVGKRDYALLMFYLLTGLRRREVINLRGKDLEYKEDRLVIKYRRKGGKYVSREVNEPLVYEALNEYLSVSGRTNVLKSDRPLWTRHDRAGHPGAPLSARAFANNLKKYGKSAGFEHLHLHQTRHTYARIVAEETGSYQETQEALDHENASTTRVYVQRITVKTDKHSSKIADRMKRTPTT